MKVTKLIPVILCGGMGSRLWPLSRASFPKLYLKIHPQRLNTFFQGTINRLKNLKNINNPIIICNEEGVEKIFTIEDLLPQNFGPDNLN